MTPLGSRILVVDDDPAIHRLFQDLVASGDLEVLTASDSKDAWDHLGRQDVDVTFLDLALPGEDGLRILSRLKERFPDVEVVILTGRGSIESAVTAMKGGALDYITKPFKASQVRMVVERVRKVRILRMENDRLRQELRERHRIQNLVGMTPGIEQLHEVVQRVARKDCTILIQGETGTGKEIVARALHYDSPRAQGPFVEVNCGAIYRHLLGAELFGHEKGAFTGAHSDRTGLFAAAAGGTLFLDDVAELPLAVQPTLLRALETKAIRPVGGTEEVHVDVRIIAATHRDLEEAVDEGAFRSDLFYRLNVVMVTIPPLRERKDDIPLLVEHFLRKLQQGTGPPGPRRIQRDALFALMRYDWPGNVRELENVIERACALGKGEEIGLEDLPSSVLEVAGIGGIGKTSPPRHTRTMAAIEREAILDALANTRGDTREAAKILGLNRSTLYRKLQKYDVALSRFQHVRGPRVIAPDAQDVGHRGGPES